MRKAALAFALLLTACEIENRHVGEVKMICGPGRPCNARMIAPIQLVGASIAVDGAEATRLFPDDLGHPVRRFIRSLLGAKPNCATALWHVPPGTHTVRVCKEGFAPIERVVNVGDSTAIRLCPADVQPLK